MQAASNCKQARRRAHRPSSGSSTPRHKVWLPTLGARMGKPGRHTLHARKEVVLPTPRPPPFKLPWRPAADPGEAHGSLEHPGPLALYQQGIKDGIYRPDPRQNVTVTKLQVRDEQGRSEALSQPLGG